MAVKEKVTIIDVDPIKMGHVVACLVGEGAGMIMHRFAWKAWQELLFPAPPKSRVDRAETLKHNPLIEYRECFYKNRDLDTPTMFHIPDGTFGKAIAAAAYDMPGPQSKAEISRLARTIGQINLYGIPCLRMDMVRQGGISRTPDVRSRAHFSEWACKIDIQFLANTLTEKSIGNLLVAAGIITGVGDWRPQKGGSCGTFRVVDEDDEDYQRIVNTQGRGPQQAAYEKPTFLDDDAEQLYTWFYEELERRGRDDEVSEVQLSEIDPEVTEFEAPSPELVAAVKERRSAAKKGRNGKSATT
jgi:hypothetical protein